MHDSVQSLWRCEAKNDPVVAYTQRIWFNSRLNLTLHVAYYDRYKL